MSNARVTARGVFDITRPGNAVLAAILPIAGAFVAGGLTSAPVAAVVAGVATAFGTAAGNAINDYVDRDLDAREKPGRPIPRGALSPRGALGVSVVAFVIALGVTLLVLPALAVVIGIVNLVVLVAYTPLLKGRYGLGNLAVAYLGGSAFLFGGVAVGQLGPVVVLFVLAGTATLARELFKDVEDASGDRAAGLATLPAVVGDATATAVANVVLVITIVLSPIPFVFGYLAWAYLAVVAIADVLGIMAIVWSWRDVSRSQHLVKYAMGVSILAFLVGSVL